MVKGFSESQVENDKPIHESSKDQKGFFTFLKEKKITYTLPGKTQINIFGSIVIGLNLILLCLIILYLNNQSFHDFIFNLGR